MQLKPHSTLQDGKYRVVRVLGQGGFGITYEAIQVGLRRKVAIKEFFMKEYCDRDSSTSAVILGMTDGSRNLVERFMSKFVREAQMIAGMEHPNIVRIHDVFRENNTAYYVMEYLDGGSLESMVVEKGRLPEKEACGYIRQVGAALKYIHSHQSLHFDVKPSNVLINKSGHAILIDFGVSKHYDEAGNQTSSTPVGISQGYAPLEQYQAAEISTFTPATDIYALGATLYRLVTGNVPPSASEINEDGLPEMKGVPGPVANAIRSAMQPRRKDRPQSVDEFLALLDAPAPEIEQQTSDSEETKIQIEPSKPTDSKEHEKRPNRKIIVWLFLLILVSVAVFFVLINSGRGEIEETNPVESEIVDTVNTVGGDTIAEVLPKQESTPRPAEKLFELSVKSNPPGARIIINGKDTQKVTPASFRELQPDSYVVLLKLDGYEDVSKTIELNERSADVERVSLTMKQNQNKAEKTFGLKIVSNPSGARVLFDGMGQKGVTPLMVNDLKKGTYNITLKLEGYEDQIKTVTLKDGMDSPYEVNITFNKELPKTGTLNGHEWVDLGLSVRWATCNVGASCPEEYGGYYAWGEIYEKSNYEGLTYEHAIVWDDLSYVKFSKYNTESSRGEVDNLKKLELVDDVARQDWGGSWRMPTWPEFKELADKCNWTNTTHNGVKGFLITGPNGNSIFLPAAGAMSGKNNIGQGKNIDYWSSTLYDEGSINAYCYTSTWIICSRYYGCSIRPVTNK